MSSKAEKVLLKAKKTVEAVVKNLGINPDENILDSLPGGFAWQIARGSADVMISLIPPVAEGDGRIRVLSPIVKMESGLSLELTVRLLELNGSELPGVSFGIISKNVIVLLYERSVVQLDLEEVNEMLALVGYYADKYDDLLVNEFGGTRVCDLG
ncbi:MAG: YbjN domain-containing protein [Deltaproteobacteria bacterium]|nr:YbjN domain-containing protein [Deltaproteobacteria bacterium]